MPDFAVTYAHEIAALWLGACALFAFLWGWSARRIERERAWADLKAAVDAARDDIDLGITEHDAAELAAFDTLADLGWSKP